jgi:hypothetical protein
MRRAAYLLACAILAAGCGGARAANASWPVDNPVERAAKRICTWVCRQHPAALCQRCLGHYTACAVTIVRETPYADKDGNLLLDVEPRAHSTNRNLLEGLDPSSRLLKKSVCAAV